MSVDFGDFAELAELVEENGDLATAVMWKLRDAAGWDRLTPRAIEEIENQLAQRGLAAFPRPLPEGRRDEVRVYRLGTQMARIVEAVTNPSEHRDELLRTLANRDSDEILRTIRRLVCT